MNLQTIELDRYGPLSGISTEVPPGLSVIYGPNEAGKTLFLEGVLQLIEPDIGAKIPGTDRVSATPAGRVITTLDDEQVTFTADEGITKRIDATPHHFRNVFVVRDGDLGLTEEHTFYDRITQRVADIHTGEIHAITKTIRQHGRLTPTGRLANAEADNYTADVRDQSKSLASDIEAYLQRIELSDIRAAEREKMELLAQQQSLKSEQIVLEHALEAKRLALITESIETTESAESNINDDVDRGLLNRARDLSNELSASSQSLMDARADLQEQQADCKALTLACDDYKKRVKTLEAKAEAVDTIETQLEQFRNRAEPAGDSRIIGAIALVGVLFSGVSAVIGGTTLAVILGAIGSLALLWLFIRIRHLQHFRSAQQAVLTEARDAGFSVDTPADVATELAEFRDNYGQAQSNLRSAQTDHEVAKRRRADIEETIESLRNERDALQDQLTTCLEVANVADVASLEALVAKNEEWERKREIAGKRLLETLGEAPDATRDLTYWKSKRSSFEDRVPSDANPDKADETRLQAITTELAAVEENLAIVTDTLDSHSEAITRFRDQADVIDASSFSEEPLQLTARSIDGLRNLAMQATAVADHIEADAHVAREAIRVFEAIEKAEQEQVTTLFSENDRVSETFHTLTDGKYGRVTYDPERESLLVHTHDNTVYRASQLSRGAYDQLYFATRVGLAELLLGSQPGFFLLDDPFLAADKNRLQEGFSVLETLADEGWQILYFTAKEEVGEKIVSEADLPLIDLPLQS